jgi:hypothetical protein
MLRCPTCLSLLLDPDVKRCPACRSKIRRRSRPNVVVEHSGIADRPRPLVERELQARIQAKTAASYRQRRRAAKAARRIASLPPTVLDGDAILTHTATQTSMPRAGEAAPIIIDLPAEAMHDAVADPAIDVLAEPEPIVESVVEPEVVEPEVVEPEVVEPEVVEPDVVEPAPVAAANWQRSSSVWTDRVFNTSPRVPANEVVQWPPRWNPDAPNTDEIDHAPPVD